MSTDYKLSKIKDNFPAFEMYFLSRVVSLYPDLAYQFLPGDGQPKLQFPNPPNPNDINENGYPVYPRQDPSGYGDSLFPYHGPTGSSAHQSKQKINLVLYMSQEMTIQANTNFRADKVVAHTEIEKLRASDLELLKAEIALIEEASFAIIERHHSYEAFQASTGYNRSFLLFNIAKATHQSGNAVSKGTRTSNLLNTKFVGNNHMAVMDSIITGRAHLLQDFSDDGGKTINVDRFCHYVYLNSLKDTPALEYPVHDLQRASFDGTLSSLQQVMSSVNEFIDDHPDKFTGYKAISDVNPVGYIASDRKPLPDSPRVYPFIKLDSDTRKNPAPLPEKDHCVTCKSLGWTRQARYHLTSVCAHNPKSPHFNVESFKRAKFNYDSKKSNRSAKALLGATHSADDVLDEFQRQIAISYGTRLAAEHSAVPSSMVSSSPTVVPFSSVHNE